MTVAFRLGVVAAIVTAAVVLGMFSFLQMGDCVVQCLRVRGVLSAFSFSFAVVDCSTEEKLSAGVVLPESFLEKGRDGVCDFDEFLIAVLLGGLETTGDMTLDERHGDGVWVDIV